MRKIRRFAITLLMGLTACALAVGLSACNTVKKGEREWNDSVDVVHTHEYGSWVVEKDATCEESGSQYRICTGEDCDEKQTQSIPAKGHTKVTDKAVAVTCTTDGKTEGSHCSVCNTVFTAQEIIPATGHDVDCTKSSASKIATCMSKAYCGVCKNEYGERLDHEPDLVVVAEQIPTCLVDGWYEYKMCRLCTYNDMETRAALGHDGYRAGQKSESDFVSADTRLRTCTQKAYCGVCSLEHGEEPSHDFDLSYTGYKTDDTKKPSTLPTCTEKAFCGYCQDYYGEPLGHDLTWIDARAATCLDEGWDMHQACTRDDCGYSTKVAIPALGHIEIIIVEKEPTCTEMGYTSGTQCERCSWMIEKPQTLSALGHDGQRFGQYVAADLIDKDSYLADCTRRAYCGICDTEYGDEPVYGIHTYRTVEAKEPTCTSEGWNEYEICIDCNYSTYEENKIPMVPHTPRYFEEKPATCTEPGYEGGTICIACEQLTAIAPLGHDGYRYGQETPEHPDTIVGDCETQSYCGICGEYGEWPVGHTPRKEATCTERAECAVCCQEYGEPNGHLYAANYSYCLICLEPKVDLYVNKENE